MSHHPERTARNVRPVNQPPSLNYIKTTAAKQRGGHSDSFASAGTILGFQENLPRLATAILTGSRERPPVHRRRRSHPGTQDLLDSRLIDLLQRIELAHRLARGNGRQYIRHRTVRHRPNAVANAGEEFARPFADQVARLASHRTSHILGLFTTNKRTKSSNKQNKILHDTIIA